MNQKERTVIYYIDDLEALRRELLRDGGLTEDQAENLMEDLPPTFRAVYTLHGYGKTVDRYELKEYTEKDAEKIDINSLNNYERSILIECQSHFCGVPLPDGKFFPRGVVCIQGDGVSDLPPYPSLPEREDLSMEQAERRKDETEPPQEEGEQQPVQAEPPQKEGKPS